MNMCGFTDANTGNGRIAAGSAGEIEIRRSSRPRLRRPNLGTISSAWIADFGIITDSEGKQSSSNDASYEAHESAQKKKKYR